MRASLGRCASLLVAHGIHIVVLLLPSLVLVGLAEMDWATIGFAAAICAAAVLESLVVRQPSQVGNATICDVLAMHIALLTGVSLLAIFWLAQIERIASDGSALVLHALGGLLTTLGIVLRIAAIRALGARFISDIRVDGSIVRDGVYAWLQHPSEVGLLLIAAGGPMLLGAPRTALASLFVFLPVSLWRMRRENVALAAERSSPLASHSIRFAAARQVIEPRTACLDHTGHG